MPDEKLPSVAPLQIAGRTGLARYGGVVYEELHPKLRGTQEIKIYKEMRDNDPVVGAVIFAIEMLIRQAKWETKPAGDSREEIADAEFVEQCRNDMSHTWDDMLPEILSMLVFGWDLQEIVYKQRMGDSRDPTKRSKFSDGRIGWRKMEIRAQDTLESWAFDEEGGLRGMWQQPPPDFQRRFIPIEKALLFRTKINKGNPQGRSILRNAFRPWFFKKRIEELEAIGIERDMAGMPVLEVPPEIMHPDAPAALKAMRSDLENMVAEVRRDERMGLVIPAEETQDGKTGYRFRLLSTGGRRQIETDAIIKRYETRIAMSALAEFILMGMDKVGSFALASSKTHLFAVAVGAWLRSIATVFNQFAIPRLFELNGMRREKYPAIEPGDMEELPLTDISNFVSSLAKVGVIIPDAALDRAMRQRAGLPAPEVSEEVAEVEIPEKEPALEDDTE